MAIQPLSWLNGFSAFLLVCMAWIMAILALKFYFKEKTMFSRYYLFLFMLLAAIALGWTGITITFFSVAIYGYNLPWVKGVISFFSYSTIPVGATAIIIFTWDVFGSPKYKKVIIGGFLGLSVVYYIILYTTFQQAVVCPPVPKGKIYDDWINPNSIIFFLILTIGTLLGGMYSRRYFETPFLASIIDEAGIPYNNGHGSNSSSNGNSLNGSFYGLNSFIMKMGSALANLLVGLI